jgi:hypothetical protein
MLSQVSFDLARFAAQARRLGAPLSKTIKQKAISRLKR